MKMKTNRMHPVVAGVGVGLVLSLAVPALGAEQEPAGAAAEMQWVAYDDDRLDWTNVGAWEAREDGMQPVRVPKIWRDRWPDNAARRALSAAGIFVRFRTDSKRIVLRGTLVAAPDRSRSPEVAWERARPPYFDVYRDGAYVSSVAGAIDAATQEVVLYDQPDALAGEAAFTIALPFYYRNGEIIVNGIGIDAGAILTAAEPDTRPRVLFHGDSITHGHGVFLSRETYVWQTCVQADCVSLNLGFGGSARGENVVAQYIASRDDWDALVLAIGTNSFGGNFEREPETAAQYGERYAAFLATVRETAPTKPIICVTPVFNRSDHVGAKNDNGETPQDYRDAISRVVTGRQATDPNLTLVDGLAAFTDPLYLLPTDVVHPNVAGMLKMADNLAVAMKPVLPKGISH